MLKFLARAALGRWTIALLNILIIFVVVSSLSHVLGALTKTDFIEPGTERFEEMIDIISGMGVILIAYGVALEERASLREVFGISGQADHEKEAPLDHFCHLAGAGQLLLGLFSEIGVECVRIPNDVINTENIEHIVLGFSVALLLLGMAFLLVATIRLAFGNFGRHV